MQTLTRYELKDKIATITMDDGKANVMGLPMMRELNAALDRAQADQAVVMLVGREGMFSGGFDLGVFKRDKAELFAMLEAGARLAERLLSFPHPVLAVCTGHAIAMGAFLLMSADVRIGLDEGARIQINELRVGMTLPHFALAVSRQRLSPAHLHHAVLSAEPYAPAQAVVAGFLDEIAPPATLMAAAQTRATSLAALHFEAFTATKLRLQRDNLDAMRQAIEHDLADWKGRFSAQS